MNAYLQATSNKTKSTLSALGILGLVAAILVATPVKVELSSGTLTTNTAEAGRHIG
jgi:hypothetical protein